MANDQTYIDLDLNFTLHPVKKDVSKLTGDNAVKTALKHLILTKFFERPFQPNTGCGVQGLLFDNITVTTTIAIEKTIREAISNFEPRVQIRSVVVTPRYRDNAYEITIIFSVLDKQNPVELNIVLERIR